MKVKKGDREFEISNQTQIDAFINGGWELVEAPSSAATIIPDADDSLPQEGGNTLRSSAEQTQERPPKMGGKSSKASVSSGAGK